MRRFDQRARRVMLALFSLASLPGCGGSSHPSISATPRQALVDVAPRIRVSGTGDGAVVRATTVDGRGRTWTSTTPVADLRRDPTRPLWMLRRGRDFFVAPAPRFRVRLDLVDGGRTVAHTTITRLFLATAVRRRPVRGGLYGALFEPPGSARAPAALVVGGSEGGLNTTGIAALLASHGYPAIALAYFRAPGLPRELRSIPLEYFARALRRLRARPDVDPRRVVVIGISRGGEAALLIGATYRRLVHGVIALVPSNVVNPARDGRSPAWTLHGHPVPRIRRVEFGDPHPILTPKAVIPAERIAGPILTASGGLDEVWPSYRYAAALHARLDAHGFAQRHHDLRFDDAGHGVGSALPYLPTLTYRQFGGSAAADEAAKARLWQQILAFMHRLRTG